MEWLKPSILAFIILIFAVNTVEPIPIAVNSTIASTDVTRIDTTATVAAKKEMVRSKRADGTQRGKKLREAEYRITSTDLSLETSTKPLSNSDKITLIIFFTFGGIFFLICIGLIIFSGYAIMKRGELYEEMHQNRLHYPQVGYNLYQQPNMTPARTATATPTTATSRTSNEGMSNTRNK